MSTTTDKNNLITMILQIKQKVEELNNNERKDILQMVVNSGIEDSKIQTKGRGTQIKFADIPPETIISMHKYIQNKINEKMENLRNFTEENEVIDTD